MFGSLAEFISSRIVLIVGLKGSGFDRQILSLPTALVGS